MHVEVPKSKLHSFREFAAEYAMIVVSIITALGLEHAVQTWHHRHLAHEATVKIEAELRQNLKEIETNLDHNERQMARAKTVLKGFIQDLQQGVPDKEAMARLVKQKDFFALSVHSPTLRHETWDVAVANQSASWMDSELLERYAGLYAHMRDNQAIEHGANNKFLDGPHWINVGTDLELGRASAQEVAHVLGQIVSAYGSYDGNLASLREDLADTIRTGKAQLAHR